MNEVQFTYLGKTSYSDAWELQRNLVELRRSAQIPDTLLLTEHDPVYTIGRTGSDLHLLAGREELHAMGVPVYHTDRGGDVTYHGPGQLVGYPILDLNGFVPDLHRYLRDLEEVIIRALAAFGVAGTRISDYTGVWVGGEKICAMGIKSSRWITMHGFALNVSTDLAYFRRIIPCGIFERGVTSLAEVLGRTLSLDEVSAKVVAEFGEVFGARMVEESAARLLHTASGGGSDAVVAVPGNSGLSGQSE